MLKPSQAAEIDHGRTNNFPSYLLGHSILSPGRLLQCSGASRVQCSNGARARTNWHAVEANLLEEQYRDPSQLQPSTAFTLHIYARVRLIKTWRLVREARNFSGALPCVMKTIEMQQQNDRVYIPEL